MDFVAVAVGGGICPTLFAIVVFFSYLCKQKKCKGEACLAPTNEKRYMLNRRFLREKTLQTLYAFYQSGGDDAPVAEKNMVSGFHKLYELYIRLASVIVELSDYAQHRIDEGKQKHTTATI